MRRLHLCFFVAVVACRAPDDPKAGELRGILRETVNTFKEAREKINLAQTNTELFALMEDFTQKIQQLAEKKRAVLGPQGSISRERMKKLRIQLKPEVEAFQAEIFQMRDTVIGSRWNTEAMLKNPKFKDLKAKLFTALKDLSRNDEVP